MDVRLGRRGRPHCRTVRALTVLAALLAPPAGAQEAGLPLDSVTREQLELYESAVQSVLPVPPALIDDFHQHLLRVRGAAAKPRRGPPRTRGEADLVSLEPGHPIPVVRLAPGIATVITFADAAGQPWPVAGYVLGDSEGFHVMRQGGVDGQQGPSHVTAAPRREAGWTNLVVTLAGQPIPVNLALTVDPEKPHHRLDVQVMAPGPNSPPGAAALPSAPSAGSSELLRFVAAADVPDAAVETRFDAVPATRVWIDPDTAEGGRMWVRSPHALLGPDWTDVISGPGGVRVYSLSPPAGILLFSVDGVPVTARVDLP